MMKTALVTCPNCGYAQCEFTDSREETCRTIPSHCDETGDGFETVRAGHYGWNCPECGYCETGFDD